MNISESTVKEFLNRNISEALFTDGKFKHFIQLAQDGSGIAAAEEYCKITGAGIAEAHLAVSLL